MEATIEVTGLRKRFGPALALDGMTFNVQPGQVTRFVGPNGAGKSPTMRVILGLDAPQAGPAPGPAPPPAKPQRPQPPALAGVLAVPDDGQGRRGHRAGRTGERRQ